MTIHESVIRTSKALLWLRLVAIELLRTCPHIKACRRETSDYFHVKNGNSLLKASFLFVSSLLLRLWACVRTTWGILVSSNDIHSLFMSGEVECECALLRFFFILLATWTWMSFIVWFFFFTREVKLSFPFASGHRREDNVIEVQLDSQKISLFEACFLIFFLLLKLHGYCVVIVWRGQLWRNEVRCFLEENISWLYCSSVQNQHLSSNTRQVSLQLFYSQRKSKPMEQLFTRLQTSITNEIQLKNEGSERIWNIFAELGKIASLTFLDIAHPIAIHRGARMYLSKVNICYQELQLMLK